MRYLTADEVLVIHEGVIRRTGGGIGVRDMGALEAAISQPKMTFAGDDLYPTTVDKAAALAFSLINNHPFVDGNKRTGHAAMEVFLILNGYEIEASLADQYDLILDVAAGAVSRTEFAAWLEKRVRPTE